MKMRCEMRSKKTIMVFVVSLIAVLSVFSYVTFIHPVVLAAAAGSMPSAGTADLKVTDLSEWNDLYSTDADNINFSVLKTQVDAVYIRSFSHTSSKITVDKQAANFASSAQNANLKYGFYFYFIPTANTGDARAQARIFYNFVKSYSYSCVPVLDVEDNTAGLPKAQLAASVQAFTDEFKSLSGFDMMIYTNPYFMSTSFDTSFNWSQYMLWIAQYDALAPMSGISSWMPQSSWCWSSWNMWQYTSTDTLSSIPLSSGNHLDMSHATPGILLNSPAAAVPVSSGTVIYQSHVQNSGWQDWVSNGADSGTSGQSRRLEAIRIMLDGMAGGIEYKTQVQDIGWMDWVADGNVSGTSGQSKRLEAIQIRLTGAAAAQYDVYYRVHAQDTGWMDWAKNGESAGTAGYSYRLESIDIRLVAKGSAAPGSTTQPYKDFYSQPLVSYQTHVQDIGWQGYVSNGTVSGTSAQSKRLEAIQIKLQNIAGGIEYRTHVQDIGWMDWAADDGLSGTYGQSKRLEAIQISLTGAAKDMYDVYYCVHAQNNGWLDWAKNGEPAGTAGFSYRLEAIKVVLVFKGGAAPGPTARPFVQA